MEMIIDVPILPLQNTNSQSGWCLLEQDTDVTLLNTLVGFIYFLYKEAKMEEILQIQDMLNKEEGVDPSVAKYTQLLCYLMIRPSKQGGVFSLYYVEVFMYDHTLICTVSVHPAVLGSN